MSSVDNRIVNMQFNNKDFVTGASDSEQALNDLEKTIDGMGSGGGLESMGSSIDSVSSKFSALQVAGVAALATIASQATSAAINLGQNLLGSVTSLLGGAGFSRAIDLQQAAFQFRGLGLDVKEVMQNATDAVYGTSFALNEAATVATQFAGSGVKAGDDMTTALRGVAGVAAQTGKSFSEIGQIFAGISGTGKVTTQDFLQFGVRGLDITEALAKQMGVTQTAVKEMLSEGTIGFHDFALAMDNAFGKNAAKANRTFTGALANMKTAVSRIGAGFFAEALKPAGDIFNALSAAIKRVQDALFGTKKVGEDFTGGFGKVVESISGAVVHFINLVSWAARVKDIMEGLSNIFAPFSALLHALGDAWAQVFPDEKGDGRTHLKALTEGFITLTKPLAWLADQIPKLTPIFVAFFEVLKVGWGIIGGLANVLGSLVSKASEVGSNIIEGLMQGLTGEELQSAIIKFADNIIEWIKSALGIHSPASTMVPIGEAIVQGIAQGMAAAGKFLLDSMKAIGAAIINGFKDLFSGMDTVDWATLFNAILTGGLVAIVIKFIHTLDQITSTFKGFATTIQAPFAELTSTLKTMQNSLRAKILLDIAISVGILSASLIALSLIKPAKLAVGIGAIAALLTELLGSLKLITKIEPERVVAAGTAILLISTSMVILAGAVAVLGNLGLDTLAKGLSAMGIALGIMVLALKAMTDSELAAGLPAAAAAMAIMAVAMNILAGAIAVLGNLGGDTLIKGIAALSYTMAIMVGSLLALGSVGPAALAGGAAIGIVAAALVLLTGAIAVLGRIKLGSLATALGAMFIALTLIVVALGALAAIGPLSIVGGEAILLVAQAMLVLTAALVIFSKVKIGTLALALGAMAVALAILVVAGAAAMGVAPGLAALGLAFLALGAGIALAGVGILAAATGLSILAAVGSAAFTVLVGGIASLLAILPQMAISLAVSIVTFIETIAALGPRLEVAFGKIIDSILDTISEAIPHLKVLANQLIGALLDVIHKNLPEATKVMKQLIRSLIAVVVSMNKEFVDAGLAIIVNFLNGIANKTDDIIDAGTDIIVNVIKGIGKAGRRIITAAVETIDKFLHALPPAVHDVTQDLGEVGIEIAEAIAQGLYDGIVSKGIALAKAAAIQLANALPEWMQKILGIASPSKVAHWWGEMIVAGLVNGIRDHISDAVGATVALANAVVAAGDKVVAKAQKESAKKQIAADRAAAKAQVSNKLAKAAEKLAQQSPNNKALQRAAKTARNLADKQAKAAQKAQKKADAAAQHVADVQAFRAADDQGKGDILTQQAAQLSDRAVKALAKANAEAIAAKKLHGKQREDLLKQAKEDAAAAKRLADRSKKASKDADKFYADAVKARIKGIKDQQKADEKAAADQAEFDNATAAGKVDILQQRAEAAQRRSEALQKQSEALVKQAKKLAKTDARKAQHLLDKAEKLAQQADDASQEAKDAADQAAGIKNDSSSNPPLKVSMSAMEDAASAIDRYTESLRQAQEAEQAATPVLQFVQNNNSPESLTDTEIYRQTKNLLSAAEVKMGAPTQ